MPSLKILHSLLISFFFARTNNISIKNSERNLKDRSAYVEEQLEESQNTICRLKAQLEESEWKVCERNGELALLKTQLKEANVSRRDTVTQEITWLLLIFFLLTERIDS